MGSKITTAAKRDTRHTFEGDLRALRAIVPVALRAVALALLCAPLVTGCAALHAAPKPAERPALVVPPPPGRIIEPAPEPPSPPEPVPELPTPNSSPSSRPGRPPAAKPAASESKSDPTLVDPKPVELPPAEAAPPAAPPAQLRTPQTADTGSAAKTVRTTIDTVRGILNTVNYGPLSNERKKAYNDAKLLATQAEDAMKEGNLVFAQALASKAETLAKGLAGR